MDDTPFDYGERLTPELTTPSPHAADGERESEVGFRNDQGELLFSVSVKPLRWGYRLDVVSHADEYLQVRGENPPPRFVFGVTEQLPAGYREHQHARLVAALRQLELAHGDEIMVDEIPGTTLTPRAIMIGRYADEREEVPKVFVIQDVYASGWRAMDQEERVPIGWEWREWGPVQCITGMIDPEVTARGDVIPSDVDSLITRATRWVRAEVDDLAANRPAPGLMQESTGRHSRTF